MDKARILFVYPPPGDIPGEIISLAESIGTGDLTTNGLPCHVAVFVPEGLIEAILPVVSLSPFDKYDGDVTKEIEIDVPDLAGFYASARKQLNLPYSFATCAEAEIFALTGKIVKYNPRGRDCSQVGIISCRGGLIQILGCEPSRLVRPSDMLSELLRLGGKEV